MNGSSELALAAAEAIAARKGEEIVILDMSGISSYCDAFVLCHATNRRQVRAIDFRSADRWPTSGCFQRAN